MTTRYVSGILWQLAARKRESVARQGSSESEMTYTEFMKLFPDNDACVEYLRQKFFPTASECPKCGKATKWHRIKSRAAYSCQYCGPPLYPTAGTIFHKSTTSLQLWFWAISNVRDRGAGSRRSSWSARSASATRPRTGCSSRSHAARPGR